MRATSITHAQITLCVIYIIYIDTTVNSADWAVMNNCYYELIIFPKYLSNYATIILKH